MRPTKRDLSGQQDLIRSRLDPIGDLQAYLADVLERVVSGRTKRNELHTLPPWN
jgi:hypothetical protein